MKLDHYLTPYTKLNTNRVKDLKIRPETIKFLKETEAVTSLVCFSNFFFLDLTPKAKETSKINKTTSN